MEFHKLVCNGNEMSITHKKSFDRIFVFEFCQSNFLSFTISTATYGGMEVITS
jgi:hypothetical protein